MRRGGRGSGKREIDRKMNEEDAKRNKEKREREREREEVRGV